MCKNITIVVLLLIVGVLSGDAYSDWYERVN